MRIHSTVVKVLAVLALGATGLVAVPGEAGAATPDEGPVPRAVCGPGSLPETGLQGQVPAADRHSGRSREGSRCNLELVGQYQGEGASWQNAWYGHCDYYDTVFAGSVRRPGVQVVDVSDPARPRLATTLTSPAMAGPWESLKVHEGRGLLAGVSGGPGFGAAFFDVYDVAADCTRPRLLASLPLPTYVVGHEGTWAPDGRTYWVGMGGGLAAIAVDDPTRPRVVYVDNSRVHGLSVSEDGTRAYLAQMSLLPGEPNGLRILDVSEVQRRAAVPRVREVATLHWTDGGVAQHSIPVTWGGRPYLVFVDEGGPGGATGLRAPAGATRIIDIADERSPRIVSKLKLEIQMPAHAVTSRADTEGNGLFGYQAHYCVVDRPTDPTALACGYFQSGVRVFDVRDPYRPKEIAYYNPPAQVGRRADLRGSEHANGTAVSAAEPTTNLTTDWCTSQVRFAPGGDHLWAQCQDNGFMVLRFTNHAYPLSPLRADPAPPPAEMLTALNQNARVGTGAVASPRTPPASSLSWRERLALVCVVAPGASAADLGRSGVDFIFPKLSRRAQETNRADSFG